MILVDTSVWIDHFRRGNKRLQALLNEEMVLCHSFVVGELACGNLHNREEILNLLAALPEGQVAEHSEVLHILHSHKLYGQGLGWIDSHLLASALLSDCDLWTLDKLLRSAAKQLGISFEL
jgi:predicted nucleic acid-binding protein